MARLNDDAQWIVLMGFLVSFGLFYLALVFDQSVVVGQTTAEGVIEFPKNDFRDLRHVILETAGNNGEFNDKVFQDITNISLKREDTIVNYSLDTVHTRGATSTDYRNYSAIHFNNGVTQYSENWTSS